LVGGHTREVTIASTIVAIIQDFVGFIDGKTSLKNSVNPTSIENISDEEVARGQMANASMIILREMRLKLLCAKVDEEVPVPGVIEGDEEEVFVGKIRIDGRSFSIQGKICNEFG
jgi:hypothetical protein